MKKADFKNLEKVLEHYEKIMELLDETFDSVLIAPQIYPDKHKWNKSASALILDMRQGAKDQWKCVTKRITQFKKALKQNEQ